MTGQLGTSASYLGNIQLGAGADAGGGGGSLLPIIFAVLLSRMLTGGLQ